MTRQTAVRTISLTLAFAASVASLTALAAAPERADAAVVLRHVHLVKSVPAEDSTVEAPKAIQLWFSEKVSIRLISVKVVGANGAEAQLGPAAYDGPEAKESPVTLAVKAPLAAGAYTLNWTVAGADGHPVRGSFSFAVKAAQ